MTIHEEPEPQYRVAWRIPSTGAEGHGKPMSRKEADALAEANSAPRALRVDHWVERVGP